MRLLGYARVSTTDQSVSTQRDALTTAGCEHVWTDVASGALANRPALGELLTNATAGDTVVVTRLDRLGRSLPHLLSLVEDLGARDVGSLAEQIDTTSATGRLVLHVFGALAEFERGLNHADPGRPGRRSGAGPGWWSSAGVERTPAGACSRTRGRLECRSPRSPTRCLSADPRCTGPCGPIINRRKAFAVAITDHDRKKLWGQVAATCAICR